MNATSPQILYMILVLPTIFGLVLIGDGINQVIHEEMGGVIAIVFGVIFMIAVIAAYFFFTNFHG